MALAHLLDQLLLCVDVHLEPLAQFLLVPQLKLLQLLRELSEELLVLLVQHLLVFLHLLPARLLQLGQGGLMVPPEPLVAGHLLVHFLLEMFLLLPLHYRGRPDRGKVLRVHCGLVRVEVGTDRQLARIDLEINV